MKPKYDVESVKRLSRYDDPNRRGGSFPRVAFQFQPGRGDNSSFGSDDPSRQKAGFSRLAREVLRADASRTFGLETAVLAFVTLVSAWPIAIMIREVIRLLR